jgi:hypothetical protein
VASARPLGEPVRSTRQAPLRGALGSSRPGTGGGPAHQRRWTNPPPEIEQPTDEGGPIHQRRWTDPPTEVDPPTTCGPPGHHPRWIHPPREADPPTAGGGPTHHPRWIHPPPEVDRPTTGGDQPTSGAGSDHNPMWTRPPPDVDLPTNGCGPTNYLRGSAPPSVQDHPVLPGRSAGVPAGWPGGVPRRRLGVGGGTYRRLMPSRP